MRKRIVVKLVLELEDPENLLPEDLLPDIVEGTRSWGGQREPFVDPLFYPYTFVSAEVMDRGEKVSLEVDKDGNATSRRKR